MEGEGGREGMVGQEREMVKVGGSEGEGGRRRV